MCVQDIPATNTKPTAFLFPAVTIPRGTQFPAPPVAGRRVPARRSVSFRASNLAIQLVQSGFDRRTTHLLENGSTQVAWGNNVSRAGAAYTVLPVMSGFYLYGVLSDNQKARETGVLGGEALLDGLIVSQLLKLAAGRNRPTRRTSPVISSKAVQVSRRAIPSRHGRWLPSSPTNTGIKGSFPSLLMD